MNMKKLFSLSFILLLTCYILTGCKDSTSDAPKDSLLGIISEDILTEGSPSPSADSDTEVIDSSSNSLSAKKIQAKFDVFMDEIFVEEVQSDSITLNYTLEHPENYGIVNYKPTLGHYTLDSIKEGLATSKLYLTKLKEFNYDSLTKEQQLTYDIMLNYLTLDEGMDDLYLYSESLSPTTGMQAQLPVLLAEYNFYTKADIKSYLDLFPCIYDYYEDLADFEREKSKAGLFMSDFAADDIIKQCEDFIKDKDNNYLVEIFNDKINTFDDLSESKKKELIAQNKEAISTSLIPAYELLISTLKELKGTGTTEGGLSNYPNGKEYYKYLVSSSTGSSKTIEEIDTLLDKTIAKSMTSIVTAASLNPDLIDETENLVYPLTDPKEILTYLKKEIQKDFPLLESVNCTIKYVHESLEDSLSPAFYLTPAIDNYSENSIYINGGDQYDLSSIFTTIAHEGYPGHLYQSVYYNQQNPAPIRSLLSFGGYSEGWATYVEMYSYQIAGLDKKLASILEANMVANLSIYAKIDIGINYYGWSLEKTTKYLNDFGITSEDDIKTMYKSMVEEPSNYMKYTLGYLEIISLRDKAKKALGDKFVLKDFHTFLLNVGPAQFDIIGQQLDEWIAAQ